MKFIIFFLITSISLLFSDNISETELGRKINISFDNYKFGQIKVYSKLNLGISYNLTFSLEEKDKFIFIANQLTTTSDSFNAPEAFEIIQNNKEYIQCLRIKNEYFSEKQETCAMQKEIDSSPILIRKKEYLLKCQEGLLE